MVLAGMVEGVGAGVPSGRERERLDAVVGLVASADRVIAQGHAIRQAALAAASEIAAARHERDVAAGGSSSGWAFRAVAEEIAAATGTVGRTVEAQMDHAATVVSGFPGVQERMTLGLLSPAHARVIVAEGARLDGAARGGYEREVLERLTRHPMTAAALRPVARTIADDLAPEPVAVRHGRARRGRQVRFQSEDDGMGTLTAYLPAVLGAGIMDRLTGMAEQVRTARHHRHADRQRDDAVTDDADAVGVSDHGEGGGGRGLCADDDRTLDQLRTDVFADLLLTGSPTADPQVTATGLGAIRGTVQVTIPARALTGHAADTRFGPAGGGAAFLAGHGPLPPETARDIAAGAAVWDRLFTHPDTGVLLTVDQYRPTTAQRRLLRARDEHCRFPGCRRPLPGTDIDHTLDHAHGGPTTVTNLAHLCRAHHTLKHHSAWGVVQHPGGILTWTSPLDRTYTTTPPPVTRFTPTDPDPPPF